MQPTTKICNKSHKYPPFLRWDDYICEFVMKVIKYPSLLRRGDYR